MSFQYAPFHYACKTGDVAKVKDALANGIKLEMGNNIALHLACENGHADIASLLLNDSRIDPIGYANYAIRAACINGHTDIVKLLLQDGRADPTDCWNAAIQHASKNGHIDVVKALLQDGRVDPTANNNYAINNAATQEIKELLIAYKYRVDGPEYRKLKAQI
jgi:ankyrin repeat protein